MDSVNGIPAPPTNLPHEFAEEYDNAAVHEEAEHDDNDGYDDDGYEETLVEELSTLFDDGKTYAEAELAFQKTRAKLAGRSVGAALAYIVIAMILLHIAFLALAVGLVIALAPMVTIWGAIAIVVGALLLLTTLLGIKAMRKGNVFLSLFSSDRI